MQIKIKEGQIRNSFEISLVIYFKWPSILPKAKLVRF